MTKFCSKFLEIRYRYVLINKINKSLIYRAELKRLSDYIWDLFNTHLEKKNLQKFLGLQNFLTKNLFFDARGRSMSVFDSVFKIFIYGLIFSILVSALECKTCFKRSNWLSETLCVLVKMMIYMHSFTQFNIFSTKSKITRYDCKMVKIYLKIFCPMDSHITAKLQINKS